jgi:hypothetical protein
LIEKLKNPLLLRLFFLKKLPLALIAGLKVHHLDEKSSVVSMRYGWITKNPFKSMYFAAQSMAAEFSTAVLAVQAIEQSGRNVALIITGMKAEFLKKATSRVTFTCEDGLKYSNGLKLALENKEAIEIEGKAVGRDANGEIVSVFYVTWSFKERED